MNYLSILLVASGLFLSTSVDQPATVNFENLTDVHPDFVKFLSLFEKSELPYEMSLEEVIKLTEDNFGVRHAESSFLNNFLAGGDKSIKSFSRIGPMPVTPLKRFYPTDKTIAVTYLRHGFTSATGAIMIAIYNLRGKLLSLKENNLTKDNSTKSKRKFGASNNNYPLSNINFDNVESFKITTDGLIHKKSYENIWEKDYQEVGFEDNEVIERRIVSEEILEMNVNGTIQVISKYEYEGIAAARP